MTTFDYEKAQARAQLQHAQDEREARALQRVDMNTGEVLEEDTSDVLLGTDAVVAEMESGRMPLPFQKLQELPYTPQEKEEILSAYVGTFPRRFETYANMEVEVQGAMLNWHPAFAGKDGQINGGYYYLLLLTTKEDENGNLIVIKSSSSGLAVHMANAMSAYGWYVWPEPVTYRFSIGDDGSHRMTSVKRPAMLKSSKGKK